MKNAFDERISRLDMSKERIKELEYMAIETSPSEKRREKRKQLNDIAKYCGTIKKYSLYLMEMSEGEGSKRGKEEEIFEVTSENFPKLMTTTKPQIQKLRKCQKSTPGYIIFKL